MNAQNLTLKALLNQVTSSDGIRAGTNQAKLLSFINDGNLEITEDESSVSITINNGDVHTISKQVLVAIALIDGLGPMSLVGIDKTVRIWSQGAINSFGLSQMGKTLTNVAQAALDMLDFEAVKRAVYKRPTLAACLELLPSVPAIEPLLIDEDGKALLEQSKAMIQEAKGAIDALNLQTKPLLGKRGKVSANNGRIIRLTLPAADIAGAIGKLVECELKLTIPPQFSEDFTEADLILVSTSEVEGVA